jgi:cytoskeletal protein CcmA (bactofilin family)
MDPNKETPASENEQPKEADQQAPADALSRTPEDLEQEESAQAAAAKAAEEANAKKLSPLKKFFRKVNLYFLIFGLLVVIAGAVAIVYYFNSQKANPQSSLASQNLTQDSLKQLANTDASVGSSSQTLTIKGNAVIEGQTLMRGALNVAGNFQTAGTIQGSGLTISGSSNLGEAQINSLQVATNTALQGTTTMRDLNVAGAASFSGGVTASQITVTRLIISGNGLLQVPNHISFTGPAPSRSVNNAVLGAGGSASVNGSDTSGTVNISTGAGTVAGCFVQINFALTYNSQPRVIITPAGAAAGQTQYYVVRSPSNFSICTASPAPTNQTFAFDYFVSN